MIKLQSCLICLVVTLLGAQAAPTELTGEGSNGDSVAPNPYQELFLNEYRSACLQMSGSEAGYLKTVSAFRPATMCFVESEGVAEFMLAIRQNGSTKEARTAIIDRYFPALNRSLECFNDIVEGAAMCSGDDLSVSKEIYSKMMTNYLELLCKDGGQFVFDFQKEEVQLCVSNIVRQADHCKMYDNMFKKPISQFKERECRILKQSKKCLKDLADRCQEISVMDVFNAAYNPIEEASKCNQYDDDEADEEEENAV
ncbi:uncharacterized protein LOC6043032 [Culex quinquefasciatus]|uniref:uncharacterized protein LOC6043032 n=1 Tax=Culex quinquefasciatus TaxID=7176 RepID=UPI0018E383EE|nr:uncharacterized protein LOC6043032 [Culex quinquefasciatus]